MKQFKFLQILCLFFMILNNEPFIHCADYSYGSDLIEDEDIEEADDSLKDNEIDQGKPKNIFIRAKEAYMKKPIRNTIIAIATVLLLGGGSYFTYKKFIKKDGSDTTNSDPNSNSASSDLNKNSGSWENVKKEYKFTTDEYDELRAEYDALKKAGLERQIKEYSDYYDRELKSNLIKMLEEGLSEEEINTYVEKDKTPTLTKLKVDYETDFGIWVKNKFSGRSADYQKSALESKVVVKQLEAIKNIMDEAYSIVKK